MCLVSDIRTLYKGHGHLQGNIFPRGLEIRIRVISFARDIRLLIIAFFFISEGIFTFKVGGTGFVIGAFCTMRL